MNELKLLKGDPIEVYEGVSVYPLTLAEIADIGEEIYNSLVKIFLINKSILDGENAIDIPIYERDKIYNYNDLEFVLYMCSKDITISYFFIEGLKLFLKSEIYTASDIGVVIKNENANVTLTNEIYKEIKKVVCKQNFINNGGEDDEFKPANAKAAELANKIKKMKAKLKKQNSDEGLNLSDIISIVSTYSNDINILNVWNLTINQLYESYLRLIMWDNYHTNYIHLPHMDEEGRNSLQHWANKLKQIK